MISSCRLAVLLMGTFCVSNALADIATTKHNLSVSGPGDVKASVETQICIFCHTPHGASPAAPLRERTVLEHLVEGTGGRGETGQEVVFGQHNHVELRVRRLDRIEQLTQPSFLRDRTCRSRFQARRPAGTGRP